MCDAARFHAEEKGDHAASDGNDTNPVHCFDAVDELRLWGFDGQEEDQADKGNAVEWEIDVEAPSPADFLCKGAADDGTDTRCDRPHHSHDTVVLWSLSHRVEVADADID